MSIPTVFSHTGALQFASAPGGPASRGTDVFETTFQQTYGNAKRGRPSVVSATDLAPFVLPFEGMTKVRALAIVARGGSGKLVMTSTLGTDQVVPLGGGALLLWQDPNPGDELTAIKFVGSADLDYVLGGD